MGEAVKSRMTGGQALESESDHPIRLLRFPNSHDSYHYGHIKLALSANRPILDSDADPIIGDVWTVRKQACR